LVKDILGILGILLLLVEIDRFVRRHWFRRLLEKKKKEKRPRKPSVLRLNIAGAMMSTDFNPAISNKSTLV